MFCSDNEIQIYRRKDTKNKKIYGLCGQQLGLIESNIFSFVK